MNFSTQIHGCLWQKFLWFWYTVGSGNLISWTVKVNYTQKKLKFETLTWNDTKHCICKYTNLAIHLHADTWFEPQNLYRTVIYFYFGIHWTILSSILSFTFKLRDVGDCLPRWVLSRDSKWVFEWVSTWIWYALNH